MVSVSGTDSGPEAIGDLRNGSNTRFRNCGTLWPPGSQSFNWTPGAPEPALSEVEGSRKGGETLRHPPGRRSTQGTLHLDDAGFTFAYDAGLRPKVLLSSAI
jgi:hypothetical protein